MAIVTASEWTASMHPGVGVNLQWLSFLEGLVGNISYGIERTPSLYRIYDAYGDGIQSISGSGFTYDATGAFTGGVITGWEQGWSASAPLFSITGLSLPATALGGFVIADPYAPAANRAPILFDAADTMFGSSGGDRLWGYGGNDTILGGGGDDDLGGGSPAFKRLGDPDPAPDPAKDGSNYLRGDDGNDTITGGAAFDDINGNRGNDLAHGGGGDDWVVGGKDDDLLYGDDGADIVYGNLGNDTCDGGAGNDLMRGGQENDSLAGGPGDDWLSGDMGADSISGGAGADVFHSFGGAGIDRVLDFKFAEGDRVQLDLGTEYTTSQVSADVVINMAGGGQMVLVGVTLASLAEGWIFTG